MTALVKTVMPMGGFWWQLMDGGGSKLAAKKSTPAQCRSVLAPLCTAAPSFWNKMALYNIPHGGKGLSEDDLRQYTAEFRAFGPPATSPPRRADTCARAGAPVLTRGPYAMLGYSWYGCTGSAMHGGGASPDPPRATECACARGPPPADPSPRFLFSCAVLRRACTAGSLLPHA